MLKKSITHKTANSLLDEEFGIITNLPDHNNSIAELAYYKAQNIGFEAGHELDDWLEAERDFLL